VSAKTTLSSSVLILFRIKCSLRLSRNFLTSFLFPENGTILPARIPFVCSVCVVLGSMSMTGVSSLVLLIRGFGWFLFLKIVSNNLSTGSDISGTVSKLPSEVSVSVFGSGVGVCGFGEGVVLLGCSRSNVSKTLCLIVGSPPMKLRVNTCSSSELDSLGGRKTPLRDVVGSGYLVSKDGARVQQLNLCYDFEVM
jgi:hypothetical protein